MHDGVHVSCVQSLKDRIGVADVRLDERKPPTRKVVDPFLLDGAGIEGVEVVYGRDAMTVVDKAAAEMTTDEPGAPCYENMHTGNISTEEAAI
jgi:hypothetical protein